MRRTEFDVVVHPERTVRLTNWHGDSRLTQVTLSTVVGAVQIGQQTAIGYGLFLTAPMTVLAPLQPQWVDKWLKGSASTIPKVSLPIGTGVLITLNRDIQRLRLGQESGYNRPTRPSIPATAAEITPLGDKADDDSSLF